MVWGGDYWLEEQDSSEGECILWKFSYLVVLNPESKEIEGMERVNSGGMSKWLFRRE